MRLYSLDGLRAISIILVLFAHIFQTEGAPHPPAGLLSFLPLGPLGVRVFFVISGFLITTLLLGEQAARGQISLRRFYFRRTMRIFPAYYAFIAFAWGLSLTGAWAVRPGDFLAALTYTVNYHRDRGWLVGHAWSLSIEEQFYLLWPAIMVFAGPRRALRLTLGYIALAPLLRLAALQWIVPHHPFALDEAFPTAADSIAAGCGLAMARDRLMAIPAYRKLMSARWTPWLVVLAVLGAQVIGLSTRLALLLGITLQNVAMAVLIDWAVRNPFGRLGSFLNAKPVALVGTWSYSLYLWQQPFLDPQDPGLPKTFPLNIALALLCAVTSFYVIERPSLRLREAIERRPSAKVSPA